MCELLSLFLCIFSTLKNAGCHTAGHRTRPVRSDQETQASVKQHFRVIYSFFSHRLYQDHFLPLYSAPTRPVWVLQTACVCTGWAAALSVILCNNLNLVINLAALGQGASSATWLALLPENHSNPIQSQTFYSVWNTQLHYTNSGASAVLKLSCWFHCISPKRQKLPCGNKLLWKSVEFGVFGHSWKPCLACWFPQSHTATAWQMLQCSFTSSVQKCAAHWKVKMWLSLK